ncbi:MAG TPA: T9SS type A sorting domain-containing protein [Saprospiraceae bacterium]|nr:T9SS type A sorting domain-containing protein [Saprospiraceae bacterium]HNT19778.1 T9SS type A sorting domain-containing protein [Saprospiraceae bacterium]
MKYLLIFLSLFSQIQAFAQKRFDIRIQSESRLREAIVSVPTTPPPPGGYPIVFMCHGTSGEASNFYNPVGWKELGQAENFITVFPSALVWCYLDQREDNKETHLSKFVCGDLLSQVCEKDMNALISDILFFKKIIQLISDTLKVDQNKIFMTGFSNGSSMAHKISMEATDVFSASGGSSGALHALDSTTPRSRRIPMWYMVGTRDDRYFSDLFPVELPFGGDSILIYLQGSIRRALVCQGLTEEFTKTVTPVSHIYTWNTCRTGEACAPYVFMLNKDQTHEYPNGQNHPVDAPKILWNFFNKPPAVKMTTPIRETKSSGVELVFYPNPATDFLSIKFKGLKPGPGYLKIVNGSGKVMVRQNILAEGADRVDLSGWPSGIYYAMFTSRTGSLVKLFTKV